VRSLQKLVPEIREPDIERGGAGVRAQAVSPDGSLVDDFKISVTEGPSTWSTRLAGGDRLARHRPPHRRPRG